MIKPAVNILLLLLAIPLSTLCAAFENETENLMASMDMESFGFDDEVMDIPVVLTASRLRQSQLDSPASVTVIEADTIAALGFKDIEEIFRLVPGMLVGYHSGVGEKTPSVSYHGTNLPEHRRLQVLIDGRSVYKPGLARVEWGDVPLAVEDIARIEVIRGPNSAAYGANAYLGIINILTKSAQDEKGTSVKVMAGTRGVANSYANVSNVIGNTSYSWSFGSKQETGFDVLAPGGPENRDATEAVYTTLRTHTQFTGVTNMQWQAGYKTGTNEQRQLHNKELDYLSEEDIDADDYYLWSKFNHEFSPTQSSYVQIYSQKFVRETDWVSCLTQAVADALAGGNVICGDFNKDLTEVKSEIEFQHTSVWGEYLRTVAGFRVRLDVFDSETYNGGYTDNLNKSMFANAEYKFLEHFVLNAGGMYETDDLNGEYFSPRVALNTHLSSTDTLRFIYSEAIRSPDLFEQGGQWIFTVRNAYILDSIDLDDQVLPVGTVENDLDFEKIYSKEISYFGLFPSIHGQLDLKIFYDELSGLISESLAHDEPMTNRNHLHQSGIEGQFKWALKDNDQILLSFSYLNIDDDFDSNRYAAGEDIPSNKVVGDLRSEADRESSLSAESSGSLAWIHAVNRQTQFATTFYHVNNWNKYVSNNGGGYEFSRLDFNVNHTVNLANGLEMVLQAALQYRLDNDPLVRSKNNYNDDHHIYGSARFNF